IELAHFNLLFHTKGCFLERDLHVITQVRPALSIFARPSGHATEEGLENSACPAAKSLAENIKRIVESTAETAATLGKGRVSEAVVGGAFLRVDQHIVSFA